MNRLITLLLPLQHPSRRRRRRRRRRFPFNKKNRGMITILLEKD
jgi:hypothetical protein